MKSLKANVRDLLRTIKLQNHNLSLRKFFNHIFLRLHNICWEYYVDNGATDVHALPMLSYILQR